jgi:hypothetical protein
VSWPEAVERHDASAKDGQVSFGETKKKKETQEKIK